MLFLATHTIISIYILIFLCGVLLYLVYRLLILWLAKPESTTEKYALPATVECYSLLRSDQNPILSPEAGSYWQSEGTFNPAALMDPDGNVHVLYRTVGDDGVSRLGYMMSVDGMTSWDRVAYPVFESDCVQYTETSETKSFDPGTYTSGGGWIGCEDPRLTIIGDTVYLVYIAFAGWDSIRIAYTSQSISDFKLQRWNWQRSKYLSPPGQIHKNWVLFPEKIKGKFALMYNIWPKISIHYVDTLEELAHKSLVTAKSWNRGTFPGMPDNWVLVEQGTAGERWVDPDQLDTSIWSDTNRWDTWMRGVGPTPIKTELGWLILYHAMDKKDPHRYKLGCMIVQSDNPEKVLYKAPLPLLSPDAEYENDYKNGVLFACGAVVKCGTLIVYYGGGDKHVCIASTKMSDLMRWIEQYPVEKFIN